MPQCAQLTSRFGMVLGEITLTTMPTPVSAGEPVHSPPHPAGSAPLTFWRFRLTTHHLSSFGFRPGDEVLLDTSPVGYWSTADYDGRVIAAQSRSGLILGRLHHNDNETVLRLLDGSGDEVVFMPDMEVLGFVRALKRDIEFGPEGGTFI